MMLFYKPVKEYSQNVRRIFMPREKKGRRASNPCGTCLIVCAVIVVLLIVVVMVGSVVAFNHFVSPLIGGVKFGDCIKILNSVRHSNRDKVINKEDEFSDKDLNDFYIALNSMLYQKDLSEEEYWERYEALSDEEKANISFEQYKELHPYRIDINVLSNALDLNGLISSNQKDENENGEISAAGENENPSESENEIQENQNNDLYINLIKELYFDFSALEKYPYLENEEDFSYTTFEITGKQLASVINEIMNIVASSFNMGDMVKDFEGVNIKDYIGIPVVSLKNVENKDKLLFTVELKIKKFINEVMADILTTQMNVPKFAVNVVSSLFPKDFFVTLESFPTDKNSEVNIRINHADEKTSNNLKKIVNALTERFDFQLFPSNNDNEETEVKDEHKTLFKQINNKVCDIFTTINDYVPVNFVSNEEGSATLRIAHIQSLLKMTGLFNEDDLANSVTPHMFFTTLRCLFDESSTESNKEALTSLYAQLDEKYGINELYWNNHSLFDPDTLQDIPSQIDVSSVEFKENEHMKVYVHEGQLTYLIDEAVKNGYFNQSSNNEVSAASDEDNQENNFLSLINFESVEIKHLKSFEVSDGNNAKQYSIEATLSLTLSDLFKLNSSENEENTEENPIIETLTKSLPQKLCLALNLTVEDEYDKDGNFVMRTVGKNVLPTTFKINNFDENYSKKVLDIITLMVSKFNSDFSFDFDEITANIENSFESIFDSVGDNLYCNIEFSSFDENNASNGCLVLPSVYEVVYGLQKKEIENSTTLTKDDELSKTQIKDLFVQIYNTHVLVLEYDESEPDNNSDYAKILHKYNPTDGNDFLSRLSGNYYLKTPLNSESLFGEDKINFDETSFVFNGEKGLYHDQRTMDELDTALNGGALASVINGGLNLADLITSENDSQNIIKSLSILNCVYEWEDEVLYLNFEFEASFKDNETALAEEGSNISISLESFLPEKAYLTASVCLYNSTDEDIYSTALLLNNGGIENLSKMAKIFTGGEFETDTLNNQVKDSIESAFDSIKDIFNIKYVINSEDAIVLKNVFNTINKLSHPDSDTDSIKHMDYLAYESLSDAEKDADDLALRARLQEFGRSPAFTTVTEYDNETEVKIVNNVNDLTYFNNSTDDIYSLSDINSFFDDLNNNFYISDDSLLNSDNITELTSISSSFIDFTKLYNDQRDISEINLIISGRRFTALANKFTDYAIPLDFANDNNSDTENNSVGNAKLVQSRLGVEDDTSFVEIVILVELNLDDEILSNILPTHIFLTAKLDLTSVDENGKKTYPIDLFINNFTESETNDVMRRINLLENAFNFSTGFSLDSVKENLSSQIGDVLDNFSDIFDGFIIKDNYIDLPNIYEYLTCGTIESNGHYNKEKPMFETFVSGSSKCIYGIENGNVGYYQDNNFILVYATVDGNQTIAKPIRNENDILGYYDNNEFVSIQTLPEELMNDLRSFGRLQNERKVIIPEGSNLGYSVLGYDGLNTFTQTLSEKPLLIYNPLELHLATEGDSLYIQKTDENGTYFHDLSSETLKQINTNFYIFEDKHIGISSLTDENAKYIIDNTMFDFSMLYKDQRDFKDTLISVSGNAFASILHDMYPDGLTEEDNSDFSANIVQMNIYSKERSENTDNLLKGFSTLKTVLRVTISSNELTGTNILPDYLYLTVFTIVDADAGEDRFSCEFVINNFGYYDETNTVYDQFTGTDNFINRLNVLKNNFQIDFSLDLDELKTTIRDSITSFFEESLKSFGNLKFENNSMLIPNLFQFLCDGQFVEDGTGMLNYVYGEEIHGETVINHRMVELDGSFTNPEVLRDRLKEFGNDTYINAIPVRGTENKFYNDNVFSEIDEDEFYNDMQAFYFLNNKPSFNDLQNSSIFNNLTDDIENVFNLHGKTNAVYGQDIRQNYINFGLYNYLGEQAKLKLSDKALASLINSQNTIDLTQDMMLKDLIITSVKLDYKDEFNMVIEITIKVTTKDKIESELNAMPDYLFFTTITERTVDDSGNVSYSTQIGINGFAPDEFSYFLSNIAHIEEYTSIGITKNFKTEDISNAVEKALKETLDDKLSYFIECFGKYEDNSSVGKGYIQFTSIYSELLRRTGATSGNEEDMQNVIVKLNNDNEYLTKNKFDESNALNITDLFTRSYFTDREFAYMLNNLFKADSSTSYITVEQLVILKGINPEYDGYVQLINNITNDFALTNEDSGYFIITVSIDTSEITSNVKLAPETIHISLLMDFEGNFVMYNDGDEEKSVKFIQDFTASEQALFMSIITDENNNIDVDSLIESKVKDILSFANGKTLNQSDNFDEYCGYVGNK